jgi:outer membrane biosynthesis protein TonB
MDRAEQAGLGLATAGHLALLAALSLGFAATRVPPPPAQPIEVSFVDEVAPASQAPVPSPEAPAPRLAEEAGPPEAAAPLPPVVQPAPPAPVAARPAPAPTPTPTPAPPRAAAPAAGPAPPTPAPRPAPRSTGRLSGLLSGLSDADSPSRSTQAPAATAGPAVQASLRAEVQRQLKPHWRAPTGADAELLRTQLTVTLSPTGAVLGIDDIVTTGENASNRSQVKLHQEQAVRAVRLAAPFRLPPEYYDAWKVIRPTFDKRLSQ